MDDKELLFGALYHTIHIIFMSTTRSQLSTSILSSKVYYNFLGLVRHLRNERKDQGKSDVREIQFSSTLTKIFLPPWYELPQNFAKGSLN